MDIYEIDVIGEDIFSKGYGFIILFKRKKNSQAFGYRFSSDIQSEIKKFVHEGKYKIPYNRHFKIRVYTSIIYFIIKEIFKIYCPSNINFKLYICRDFASHEKAIIERLKEKIVGDLFEKITADHYIFKSHNKKSKIQQFTEKMNKGDFSEIYKVSIDRNNLHNSLTRKRYQRKKW